MNLELSTAYPWMIILIMAIVTLATRWGGVVIMAYVPISEPVQRFITAMSGLAPIALEGDHGARFALLTTVICMLVIKKPLLAIAAGMFAAAMFRYYFN